MRYRSSALVGREDELEVLRAALKAAQAGSGGAVVLVGQAGIGKSRLAAAAADHGFGLGMRLLRGRASTTGPMVPYRSLSEALFSLLHNDDPVDISALGPYRHALARLVPDWAAPAEDTAAGSPVIFAEAVLRLAGLVGADNGCLITLEDLHDADLETLAVVEYLIDNLHGQPTLLLGTVRDEPCPALEIVHSARTRGAATAIELDRLVRDEVRDLAGACLDSPPEQVPDAAVELLWAGSAGIPILVEEMLSGMIDGGLLVADAGGWRTTGRSDTGVPESIVRSVGRRTARLDQRTRDALSAAAVLGQRFPVAVVQAAARMRDHELLGHLHSEVAAEMVTVDDQTPGWYTFRHQLIVEALLAGLAPQRRSELARRVADAVDEAYPGLPGEWCQISAGLRADAGEAAAAGSLFAEAGNRALRQGAANSAVALMDRALSLLPPRSADARADALESLLIALAEAGQIDRAIASVSLLDQMTGRLDPSRRARLHSRLAWAAMDAGQPHYGALQVAAAREILGQDASAADLASVDIVDAHLQLDLPGPRQLHQAEVIARRAAAAAEAVPLPMVACQAWQLIGTIVRPRDPEQATACLERSWSLAVRHHLPIREINALIKLGNNDAMRHADLQRLQLARRRAAQAGAVTIRYEADASLSLQLILRGSFAEAQALIDDVARTTMRLKLMETLRYVLLMRAVLAAHRGRRAEMADALVELRDWDGDTEYHAPRVHGLARAFCALLEEDLPGAAAELTVALAAEDANPTIFAYVGRYGLNLLVQAVSGAADEATHRQLTADTASTLPWDRHFALLAAAVLAGRAGRLVEAEQAVSAAAEIGTHYEMARHLGLRLVSEAAFTDGWGEPIEWLRSAEDYFHRLGVPAVAGACRALLRGWGVRVAPRRADADQIPRQLRLAGITPREHEVLRLLSRRLANREIAAQLHLSPRTVERYVSNLMLKTGLENRIALSSMAATIMNQ